MQPSTRQPSTKFCNLIIALFCIKLQNLRFCCWLNFLATNFVITAILAYTKLNFVNVYTMCTRVHARIRNFMSVSIQRSVANHCTT